MTVLAARINHVALTVRDIDASIAWYQQVFGIKERMELPHEGGTGRLLADDAFELAIVLHRHDASTGETFLESRTGLDHVGLGVATREDLVAWQSHLEANGVVRADVANRPLTQSAIADEPYGSVLVFRDPDNIQLELFASASPAE
ncbi:MAG: VOC family protein [Mycobacteriales bacterium]|nr:VOC family protein [Frankia sp.]